MTEQKRPRAVERLIEAFARLPGIGPKTSERLSYFLLRGEATLAEELAAAIRSARDATKVCSVCFNLDETDPCSVCSDESRDRSQLLVVEDPRDLASFEAAGYRGLYHVLQGRISALEGIRLEDLTTAPLVERVREGEFEEICLATNADLEGEGTAEILVEKIRKESPNEELRLTRLARGLPAGSSINQVSQAILNDALAGRRRFGGAR